MAKKAAKKAAVKTAATKPSLKSIADEVSRLERHVRLLNGRLDGCQRLIKRLRRRSPVIFGAGMMAGQPAMATGHGGHNHHFQSEDDVIREVITLLVEGAITSTRADPDEPLDELFDQVRKETAKSDGFDPLADFVRDLGAHLGWSPGFMPSDLGKPGLRTAREIGVFAWGES